MSVADENADQNFFVLTKDTRVDGSEGTLDGGNNEGTESTRENATARSFANVVRNSIDKRILSLDVVPKNGKRISFIDIAKFLHYRYNPH